jgi:hypothetical protein
MKLQEIKGEFTKMMGAGIVPDGDTLFAGLDLLPADRVGFGRWLQEFMADEDCMKFASKHSYLHANGFEKIVLASFDGSSCKLRLHMWNDQKDHPDQEGNIHNHRWSFASRVLIGQPLFEVYERGTDGIEHNEYEYIPNGEVGAFTLNFTKVTLLRRTIRLTLTEGASYSMHHSALHRVTATGPTVTVVLQGATIAEKSAVFSKTALAEQDKSRTSQCIGEAMLVDKLREVVGILSS